MSEYRVVEDYPVARERVWRALTDPAIVPLWTSTGRGGKPVGFAPIVGTRFQFVGRPTVGWNGIVDCEVTEVREPSLLRFTWRGGEDDDLTTVSWLLEAHDGGTRLTCEHTGFTGLRGFLMAKLLRSVRRKMLHVGFPAALSHLLAIALLLGAASAQADAPVMGGALSVRLVQLRNNRGTVGCALFSTERGFPKDRSAAAQTKWCPIANQESLCSFDPVPAGTYAVACFHDENDNRKMDTGLFGIPTEGVVASNQAKGFMGPPSFKDAKFSFPGGATELRLRMGY